MSKLIPPIQVAADEAMLAVWTTYATISKDRLKKLGLPADDESVYGHTALETAQLIRKSGNTKCLVKIYPGAGHLLEPPYTPLCRSVYHGVMDQYVVYGGEARLHAAAQEDMWRSLLQFFKSTFCVNEIKS